MDISAPHTPIPVKGAREANGKSPLVNAVLALEVGQAVTVKQTIEVGDRSGFKANLSSRCNGIGTRQTPKRKFSVSHTEDGVQITRTV